VTRRSTLRALDVKDRIGKIRSMLVGLTFDDLSRDEIRRAAFERYLEIVCEASRHLPDEWKTGFGPDVPWPKMVGLVNLLRHAYHRSNLEVLWSIYSDDLDVLEAAIDRMLAAYPDDEDDD
jgi:uncharacterized protein with HEPN domain